jgi:hypothetical protein
LSAFVPGSGGHNVVASLRDVCWSEPADLNGLIGSSEQILSQGLESELANDFVPTGSLSKVTFWGGYWNNSTPCASGITTPGFNLRFYDDSGCAPGNLVAFVVATYFTETSVGCQAGQYPMFKWEMYVSVYLSGGSPYWFDGQIADHPFPPQGGRLAAAFVTGQGSMFKSVYFGFPDWTPAVDVFGVEFDCSQEFECGGSTPTKKTTWGHIKSLYH